MAKQTIETTPIKKSLGLNQPSICLDSTPISCSRLKFDLHAFTSAPFNEGDDRRNSKYILISSSKSKVMEKPANDKSLNVSPKSLKRKGKENVDYSVDSKNYPHNSDFEDEIPILKRIRLKKDPKSTVVVLQHHHI